MIYEHFGENRSGKTLLHAIFAWQAFMLGWTVYCNCPRDPETGEIEHIVLFPHVDYDPTRLFHYRLKRVLVITDQAEIFMDARRSNKTSVTNIGYFNYQAKKKDVEWHYDTVRIKNIELRIRLNPDFLIKTVRIPLDYNEPLLAVRVIIRPRHANNDIEKTLRMPQRFFPLYDHTVTVPPPEEIAT